MSDTLTAETGVRIDAPIPFLTPTLAYGDRKLPTTDIKTVSDGARPILSLEKQQVQSRVISRIQRDGRRTLD